MTQYAAASDLPLYIKPDVLAALTGAPGTSPDEEIVNKALLEASAHLDAACRSGGVNLPIVADAYVVGLVCRLSLRALCGREIDHNAPDILQSTWEGAEAELRDIATNGGGIQSSATESGRGMASSSGTARNWTSML